MHTQQPSDTHRDAVIALQRRLIEWLRDRALPLWNTYGVDRTGGGYFEEVKWAGSRTGIEPSGLVRRGRVVARQIYVFDLGRRLGWGPAYGESAEHGCGQLFADFQAGDGLIHAAIEASTRKPQGLFSLYEQAFYLFALAQVKSTAAARYSVESAARRCLQRLRAGYSTAIGGFEESIPPTLPRRSNPHMHLLEAALAWAGAAENGERDIWIDLARELTGLCLTRFSDANTAAIREYFDLDWNPAAGSAGRIIEPGHQFEWAWLLVEWAALPDLTASERARCLLTARRLVELGERCGVDHVRGVAINEIWEDMSWKDGAAKLWPQTERLKAWCAMLGIAVGAAEVEFACGKIQLAARGMAQYLRLDAAGLWHESQAKDGMFPPGASKASSLYHLACAIDVLRKTVGDHLLGPAEPGVAIPNDENLRNVCDDDNR